MSNKDSSSSSPDISGDDYLKVLICSANVGNAEPTSSSFAAWVPHDGEITTSLNNTKYPVTSNEVNLAIGPYSNSGSQLSQEEIIKLFANNSDNCGGQYDIIVLGMQEAAFVSKKSAVANLTTATTERSSNDDSERVADATTTTTTDNNNNNINNNNSGEANNNNNEVIKKKERSNRKSSKKGPLEKAVNKAGMMVRGVSANQTYKRNPSLRSSTHSENDNNTSQKNLEQRINMLGYDSKTLQTLIKEQCPSYEIVTSNLRGEMRLYVLAHQRIANDISDVYCAAENTGIGSIMANKGGIIVTFTYSNMTRLSFMTCHLEAHEGQNHYNNRNKNLAEILGGAKTDPVYNMQDATIISHHMFLCGDLNYRINFDIGSGDGGSGGGSGPGSPGKKKSMSVIKKQMAKGAKLMKRSSSVATSGSKDEQQQGEEDAAEVKRASELLSEESCDESNNGKGGGGGGGGEKEAANGSHFDQAKALVEAEDWAALNSGDELAMALKQKECLVGFSTLPCHWPPTFKVGRGEGYQYNEKRTPSYTDRILWKSADGLVNNVVPLLYEPCPEFITSDHKPIRGGFAVKLNKSQNETTPKIVPQKFRMLSIPDDDRQIQVLVSDMKCTNLPIMDSELIGGLSDPYVLFVSSPKEFLYSKAWPATSIITRNLNPVWDEDMHLTMDAKGMRDGCLAEGSMLTLTVMDFDATSGDDVIGSVALNLNELCSELDLSGPSSDKVQETLISRPILRNGQEYGMLECKLKTAFLGPKEVKSFLAGAKNVRTASNISWKSKLVAAMKAK